MSFLKKRDTLFLWYPVKKEKGIAPKKTAANQILKPSSLRYNLIHQLGVRIVNTFQSN
jgi:hypothetical protein